MRDGITPAVQMHVTASAQKQWHHYKGMLAAAGGRQADDAPPQQRSKHKQETLQDGEQLAVKRARRSVAADQAAEVLASDDVQPVSSQLATSQPSACHEHEQMDSKVPQQPQQEEYQAQDARVLYDTAGCIYVSASGEALLAACKVACDVVMVMLPDTSAIHLA